MLDTYINNLYKGSRLITIGEKKMTKKIELVIKLINITENNWKLTDDKPNGLTISERKSLFGNYMNLTIPMLKDMLSNITVVRA